MFKTGFEYKIAFCICVLVLWIHKGYFVVKNWCEMFVIKLSGIKSLFYIRNLKYCTFNTIFRQHNIYFVLSTCQHKYKWILCTEKLVLNANFQDFWCANLNIHLFFFSKKNDNYTTYLKAKNSLHATRISSFKYIFIVFFEEKKRDAKIYI